MSIYLELFIASLLWGSNVIVMKILLHKLSFLFLATLRVFLSCLSLGIYMKVRKYSFSMTYPKKTFLIALFAIYLNFFFTFLGMKEVKGIDNAFMNALAPSITFLLSFFVYKQKGSIKQKIAVLLSIFAFLMSIKFQIFSIQVGFWYLLIGLSLYVIGNLLIQKWNLKQSLTFSFYELFFGFVCLFIHCLLIFQFDLTSLFQLNAIEWILFIVVSGIGFAYIQVTYMKAIEKIGAFQTSFFLSINPIVTYIESLFFLHETFELFHFISFLLLGISVYLSKKSSS